jgi:Integrase
LPLGTAGGARSDRGQESAAREGHSGSSAHNYFRACAEAYIEAHKPGWRNAKHAAQWSATLAGYAYPVFGAMPVQQIDVGLIIRILEPIWATKTETATRVRGRIESVLDWARTRGYRTGENPARWRGHLENLLPKRSRVRKVKHYPALPYADASAFMANLRNHGGMSALALEFLILTAARTGEVLGATWDEVDLEAEVWTIPATRIKAGREHRIPLSGPLWPFCGGSTAPGRVRTSFRVSRPAGRCLAWLS